MVSPFFPLRIIEVVNVRWFNATSWYGLFLSSLLREAGHDVRVICPANTDTYVKACQMGFSPLTPDLNSKNPLSLCTVHGQLSGLIRSFKPHIVNCHRGESFLLWGLLQKAGNYGLVRTRGDQRPPKGNLPNKYLHGSVANAVIATCSTIAYAMRDTLGVAEDRIHTILGGVDTRRFFPDPEARASVRESLGVSPTTRLIGLVGRFDAVKGQKELIESYATMLRSAASLPDTRLVLAGFGTSGTSEEDVLGWIRDAGVEHSVLLPGRCKSIQAVMNALDLGIIASLGSETIARVALELMACGVPLLGTQVGVMPDLLEPEALVPPGDTVATAACMQRFLCDTAFRETIRSQQQEKISSLSEKDFLEQTLAVYAKVAGTGL